MKAAMRIHIGLATVLLFTLVVPGTWASCPSGQESLVLKTEDGWDTACGKPAKVKKKVKVTPPYPTRPELRKYKGSVILQIVVTRKGRVEPHEVISEEPKGFGLADAVIDAVKKWRYKPATVNKQPVDSYETEPPRVFRRPNYLTPAAMAGAICC